jgi:WD40 repeat protein
VGDDKNSRAIGKDFDNDHDNTFITSICVGKTSGKVVSASTKNLILWDFGGVKNSEVFAMNPEIKSKFVIENAHNATTVWKILIDKSERLLYSTGQDKTLKIWDLENGYQIKFIKSLPGSHDGELYTMGMDFETKLLFTAGLDRKLGVWNIDKSNDQKSSLPKSQS